MRRLSTAAQTPSWVNKRIGLLTSRLNAAESVSPNYVAACKQFKEDAVSATFLDEFPKKNRHAVFQQMRTSTNLWARMKSLDPRYDKKRFIRQWGGITHNEAEDLVAMIRPDGTEMIANAEEMIDAELKTLGETRDGIVEGCQVAYKWLVGHIPSQNPWNMKEMVNGNIEYPKLFARLMKLRFEHRGTPMLCEVKDVDVEILNSSWTDTAPHKFLKNLFGFGRSEQDDNLGRFQLHCKLSSLERVKCDAPVDKDADVELDEEGYGRRSHVLTIGIDANGDAADAVWTITDFNFISLYPPASLQ